MKIMFSLLSIVIFQFYMGIASADDSLQGVLDGILKRYGDLPGITVTYQREIITKSMALLGDQIKADMATGKIHFVPPNNLAVEQVTPRPETIKTDGDTLWWYIPKKSVVYQYPSNMLGKELRLLSDIFQGLSEVGESFDVIQSGLENKQEYHLKLIPNPPWKEIAHIDLSVDRDTFNINVVEIHNFLGSITRFILGDLFVPKDLDEGYFRFVVPEGVKVIKDNG
ncbi:outer membrane lipoprotein carrier protein LolA [Thermodesulfobacteriota bacterium]